VATAGNNRNGTRTSGPLLMEDMDGVYQYGVCVRADWGLTLWRRLINASPNDPASYDTYDLSADATATAALDLPVKSADNHYAVCIGIDEQDRIHLAGNVHFEAQNYLYGTWSPPSAPSWTVPTFASMPWGTGGANRFTYNYMTRDTVGNLVWIMSQTDSGSATAGGDRIYFYLPPGSGTTWLPALGTGLKELASTNSGPDGTADRVYMFEPVVEPGAGAGGGDRIHHTGLWRTGDADADSQQQPFYLYHDELGTNDCYNAAGDPIPVPVTWDNRANVQITGAPGFSCTPSSLGIDHLGRPHVIVRNGDSTGTGALSDGSGNMGTHVRCYWDGDDWQVTRINVGSDGSLPPGIFRWKTDLMVLTSNGASDRINLRTKAASPLVSTGLRWKVGGPVDAALTGGGGGTWDPRPDPVALYRSARLDFLVPDGDEPRVATWGHHGGILVDPTP
jgi:hypothetical protein